jgi:uncharacterized protein (DUF488 family)
MATRHTVLTIGHSNHPIQMLIELLARHGVDTVVDVRSHPVSRFNPQFGRERLRTSLADASVGYLFLGRELGARASDPWVYVDDRVDYDRLAQMPAFQSGLSEVVVRSAAEKLALLCAEKDPLDCHRAILICPHLQARGVSTAHILADGSLENHADFGARLLAATRADDRDLLDDRTALIGAAYRQRGREIAYAKPE